MPGEAHWVKYTEGSRFVVDAALYRLEPPYTGDDDVTVEYVIVSAAVVPFSGPEAYIFPSNKDAEWCGFEQMKGSLRGSLDHGEALEGLGYVIV